MSSIVTSFWQIAPVMLDERERERERDEDDTIDL